MILTLMDASGREERLESSEKSPRSRMRRRARFRCKVLYFYFNNKTILPSTNQARLDRPSGPAILPSTSLPTPFPSFGQTSSSPCSNPRKRDCERTESKPRSREQLVSESLRRRNASRSKGVKKETSSRRECSDCEASSSSPTCS